MYVPVVSQELMMLPRSASLRRVVQENRRVETALRVEPQDKSSGNEDFQRSRSGRVLRAASPDGKGDLVDLYA